MVFDMTTIVFRDEIDFWLIYSVEIIHCEFLNCYVQFVMIPLMWPHLALWPEAHYLRLERYSAVAGEVNSGTNADFFGICLFSFIIKVHDCSTQKHFQTSLDIFI